MKTLKQVGKSRNKQKIKHLFNFLFEYISDFWAIIFPDVCEACGNILYKNESVICTKCLYDLPRTDYCYDDKNPIIQLFVGRLHLKRATALFSFHKGSKFRKLLHSLKYNSKPEIGILLGKELGNEMLKSNNFNDIDIIVPVPLHQKRQKARGYNQSEMIAVGISEIMKIPVSIDNLMRNVETTTQTKMKQDERWQNVSGKFIVKNLQEFENKHILLIDDVLTTGSTIEACGEVLEKIKGLRLSVGVLAKV